MGFIKNTLKGAVVAKVATEARKPKNQARAKSAFSSLRARFSGKPAAAPVAGRSAKTSRSTVSTGTTTGRAARKATTRAR